MIYYSTAKTFINSYKTNYIHNQSYIRLEIQLSELLSKYNIEKNKNKRLISIIYNQEKSISNLNSEILKLQKSNSILTFENLQKSRFININLFSKK